MPRINPVEYNDAPIAVQKLMDEQIEKNGRITNMKRTLLHSIPAYHALMEWYPLHEELQKFLTGQEINFLCYAISTENECHLCSTFFRKILKDAEIDFQSFTFSNREELLIEYGRAIVKDKGKISNELFKQFKEAFNDEQIINITAFTTIMIATNLVNTSLEIPLDGYLSGY